MSATVPKVGVLVTNFGEPDEPTLDKVEPFLERIFLQNAGLEPGEAARSRARQLARDRAPGLVEEYESIGGSPLNRQAKAQADALLRELRGRGWDVRTYGVFQFAAPFVRDGVAEARSDGVKVLVGLPVYPLCGTSTTAAAIADVRDTLDALSWCPRLLAVSGWHHHPAYVDVRVENIRAFVRERALDLRDPDTLLYFSVHGTPIRYLEGGNRYDRYVDEHCRAIAKRLGADRYAVGFQNHANRRIAWTQPDNEDRIRQAAERRLVVVPISFMHEQSETLAELDIGLRAFTESLGKELYRVPVPHDDPRFILMLADIVSQLVEGPDREGSGLSSCRCIDCDQVWCTNGNRELPPSPFVHTGT